MDYRGLCFKELAMQNSIPLLFVHFGDDWIRGSEVCALNLLNNLDSRFVAVLWTNNCAMASAARRAGITVEFDRFDIAVSFDSSRRRFSLLAWANQRRRTIQLVEQYQIQLIHINSGAPCQWVLGAARQCNVPSLTHLHSPYNLHDRITLGLHVAPYIVCVSHAVSHALLNEGYPKQQLSVVHNGVPEPLDADQNVFSVKQHLGIKQNEKVVVSVGSLIHRKGFDRVINAIECLHRQQTRCHLVIIGDGPEKTALKAQATNLGLEHYVHFVGEQPDVAKWLCSDVDVMVSGARSEAFGLVLVEAALARLPVIAPNVGGIGEVVDHLKTGILYVSNLNTPPLLAQHIEHLLSDSVLARRLAYNAYRKAKTQFTVAANQQSMEQLYQKQLEQNPAQAHSRLRALLRPVPSIIGHIKRRWLSNSSSATQGSTL
jgi:glycosyltransferase involved in cell wall biosynthesis